MFLKRLSTLLICVQVCVGMVMGTNIDSQATNLSLEKANLLAPKDLTFIPTPVGPRCNGENNGSIEIDVDPTSGSAPYSYKVQIGTGPIPLAWVSNQTANFTIPNLSSGSYTIYLKDSNGGESSQEVSVPVTSVLQVNLESPIPTSFCNGETVDLLFEATGGKGPYTYTLYDAGTLIDTRSDGDFSGKSSGNYTLKVVDANLCPKSYNKSLEINIPTPISFSFNTIDPSCDENSFGKLELSNLPSLPFEIEVKNTTLDKTFTSYTSDYVFNNLEPGDYSVKIYREGCTESQTETFEIESFEDVVLQLDPSSPINLLCDSLEVVEVKFTVQGGHPGRDVVVKLDNNDGISTNDPIVTTQYGTERSFYGVGKGNYTIVWQDKDNTSCTRSMSYIVTAPLSPITYFSQPYPVKDSICAGSNTGEIKIPVTGGSSPYTYYYKRQGDPMYVQNPATSGNLISSLLPGTYSVYAEDKNLCTTEVVDVTIFEYGGLNVIVSPTVPVLCESNTDGSVSATIQGGSGNYVYTIDGVTTNPVPVTGSLVVRNLAVGTYTLKISDQNCTSLFDDEEFTISADFNEIQFVSDSIINVNCDNTGGAYRIQANDGSGNMLTFRLKSDAIGYDSGYIPAINEHMFPSLVPGVYSVSVSNGGCDTISKTITIPSYKPFTVSNVPDSVSVKCYDDFYTLPITITGSASYQYQVDGIGPWIDVADNQFVVDLTSSPSGALHAISIKEVGMDACPKDFEIRVYSPDILTNTLPTVKDLKCKGDNSGEIELIVSGGTKPYTATLNTGQKASSDASGKIVFQNVVASTSYTISLVDANECTIPEIMVPEVKEPAEAFALTTPIIDSPIPCYKETTTLRVSATGGKPGSEVTYRLQGGDYIAKDTTVTTVGTGVFTNIQAGTYDIVATNADGCSSTYSDFVVDDPDELKLVSHKKFDVVCNDGQPTGKIAVSITGGTSGYSYALKGSSSTFVPLVSANDTIKNLVSGTYKLVIRDANACKTPEKDVVIGVPDSIILALVDSSDIVCYGDANGMIQLRATGGIGTLSYTITPQIGSPILPNAHGLFNGLAPDTYELTVKDANNCENLNSLSVTLKQPEEVIITNAVPTPVKCFGGSTGSIEVTANGGGPLYSVLQYSLKEVAMAPQNENVINGLKKGYYTVIVTDSRGKCAKEWSDVFVDSPEDIVIAHTPDNVSCNNVKDGSIEIAITGGVPNYNSYLINKFNADVILPSSNKFSGLGDVDRAESYYKIMVVDGNGCMDSVDNVQIKNPPALTISDVLVDSVRCFGENNGLIHIKAEGGTGELKYSLDGGTTFKNASDPMFASVPGKFTGLQPKSYSPWVTDQENCEPTNFTIGTQKEVGEPDELTATYELDSISCFDTKDAEITINAQGGNEEKPYEYSVDNETTWQSENIFKNVVPNLYKLVVKDWKGCKLAIAELDVTNPALIDLLIDSTAITCFDDNDATLRFRASGGVGPFTVSTKPLFDVGSTETYTGNKLDVTYEDLQADIEYSYYIRDKEKCPVNTINGQIVKMETSDPVLKHTFLNPPKLMVFAVDTMPERCAGEKGGSISIHAKGGVEPLEFNVQSTNASVPYHSTWSVEDSVITRLVAGNYYVLVRDAHGCKPVDTDFTPKTWTVRAQNRTEMVITVWDSEDANCPFSQDGWVKLGVRNTFENTFSWTITAKSEFEPYKLGTNSKDSLVLIEELPAQDYIFEVTDLASLCTSDTTVTVPYSFDTCEDLVIPTAFTPNGDSYNDTWRIENIELYSKMKIQIYTVNGEKVLDVDGPFEGEWGWNGQLNNDGRYLPSGTYIVLIWKDFDLVGRVQSKEDSTTNTGTNTSNSKTADGDSTANTTKAKNGKPDYIGNVTILRNF